MALPMSLREKLILDELVEAGVMDPFVEETMTEPTASLFCGDGKEFYGKYMPIAEAARKHCRDNHPNIFPLSWVGGILAGPPRSPLHELADHRAMADFQLKKVWELGYKRLLVNAHATCLMGQQLGLNLTAYLDLCAGTKVHLKEHYLFRVGMLAHFCLPDESRIFYHFSLKKWKEYRGTTVRRIGF